jgi:hypothetical protein
MNVKILLNAKWSSNLSQNQVAQGDLYLRPFVSSCLSISNLFHRAFSVLMDIEDIVEELTRLPAIGSDLLTILF